MACHLQAGLPVARARALLPSMLTTYFLFSDLEFSKFLFHYSLAFNAHNIFFLSVFNPWILSIIDPSLNTNSTFKLVPPRNCVFQSYFYGTDSLHHRKVFVLSTNLFNPTLRRHWFKLVQSPDIRLHNQWVSVSLAGQSLHIDTSVRCVFKELAF